MKMRKRDKTLIEKSKIMNKFNDDQYYPYFYFISVKLSKDHQFSYDLILNLLPLGT